MDEARHAELYARFLQEKIGMLYPINDQLQSLLGDTLRDSRWDMPYLSACRCSSRAWPWPRSACCAT